MSNAAIQLLVLAGVAIFLILKLKSVLGTREGFEKPPTPMAVDKSRRAGLEVIEGGPDRDITDHVEEGSDAAKALVAMKGADQSFMVGEFLQGARSAYEMILMGFEKGELDSIRPFLADDVFNAFSEVVAEREKKGLTVEAEFIGVSETTLVGADFDRSTSIGEMHVRFVGELRSAVRDSAGDIVEGDPKELKRQKDTWTFARTLGSSDPNWQLVATGE